MPPTLFALVIFQIRSHFFPRLAWTDWDPPIYISCVAGMTRIEHHTQLLCWDGGLANFLPVLASNHNPPNLYLLNSWDYRHEPPCLYPSWSFIWHSIRGAYYFRLQWHKSLRIKGSNASFTFLTRVLLSFKCTSLPGIMPFL
jgi:hypothetical protein